jgi:hypothetical protein
MKLFVAFLALCFLVGMLGRPTGPDSRMRWFVAALGVMLMVGYYVFNRI